MSECVANPLVLALAGWLLATGLAGFILMAKDKLRAANQRQRVPEKTFFAISVAGGFAGIIIAISVLRHKINKPVFYLPVYGITVIWLWVLWKFASLFLCVGIQKH